MPSNTLKRSDIGYNGTGADGRPVVHYQWEPFGWGCSLHCMAPDKCWAERMAPRAAAAMKPTCNLCRRFVPHFHPERIWQPWDTKKARVVLMGFHTDWGCPEHDRGFVRSVNQRMREAHWHKFVTLTKHPGAIQKLLQVPPTPNIYIGCTVRNQPDLDRNDCFFDIPGKKWFSLEPLWSGLLLPPRILNICGACGGKARVLGIDCPTCGGTGTRPTIEGVILGHDSRWGAPGTDTLEYLLRAMADCKAARVNCFCKQVWGGVCPRCGDATFSRTAMSYPLCQKCGKDHYKPRLLRASHADELALFPPDLKEGGRLPWNAPGEND